MELAGHLGSHHSMGNTIYGASEWDATIKSVNGGVLDVLVGRVLDEGVVTAETNPLVFNATTKRFTAPGAGQAVIVVVNGKFVIMDATRESTGTASSGSTTTLVDAGLTQGEDFWVDGYVVFTSGANDGQVRQITAFSSTNDRLTWVNPLGTAVQNGDTYVVTFYYIQDLANGATNYIYGTALSRTPYDHVMQWQANVTGVSPSGSVYLAQATLSAGGVVTASSDDPTGADRTLYRNVGGHDVITLTGTLLSMPVAGSVQVTRTHSVLLYLGGIALTVPADFSYVIDEHYADDQVVFTITNNGSGAADCAYTLLRKGRKREYVTT